MNKCNHIDHRKSLPLELRPELSLENTVESPPFELQRRKKKKQIRNNNTD